MMMYDINIKGKTYTKDLFEIPKGYKMLDLEAPPY